MTIDLKADNEIFLLATSSAYAEFIKLAQSTELIQRNLFNGGIIDKTWLPSLQKINHPIARDIEALLKQYPGGLEIV